MITTSDAPLLATFAAVVRAGSFSGAAHELKVSKSLVSERIKQLEDRCGARLLERTTRRLHLTSVGSEVLAVATQVSDALEQLSRELDAHQLEPSGALRISTTLDLGPLLVGPVVARFVVLYPRVRVEIRSNDVQKDIIEEGVDIAIRLGAPTESTFFARKLASLTEPIVASRALAETLGPVTRPSELVGAPWVRHALVTGASMRFSRADGAMEEIAPTFRAEVNSGSTLLSLLLHGAGVGVLPEHALREHLHNGRLVNLCPGWTWKTVSLYALMPSRPSLKPAVTAFLSLLEEQVNLDKIRFAAV